MDRGVRNTLLWTLGFIALVLALFIASVVSNSGLSDEQFRELGFYRLPQATTLEDFSLVDQHGDPVGLDSLKGRWSLLFFGFTHCPDVCPTTLSVLNRAVARMDNPPQVVFVSVDPDRDTPEVLAGYVPGFNPGFAGYTGKFDDIVGLTKQVNVSFGKVPGSAPGTYTVQHSANIIVVDPRGRYVGFIKPPHQFENIVKIVSALRQG